jgi:hypothetical protein
LIKQKGQILLVETSNNKNLLFMSRLQIENSLKDLNDLVLEGKLMDAFEKYYHDDVAMQENNHPPVTGKSANRQRELEFLSNITEFRNAHVRGIGIGDDVSFVEWAYDYTHKEWGIKNYTQISVQRWKDGKIIHEQFFYAN